MGSDSLPTSAVGLSHLGGVLDDRSADCAPISNEEKVKYREPQMDVFWDILDEVHKSGESLRTVVLARMLEANLFYNDNGPKNIALTMFKLAERAQEYCAPNKSVATLLKMLLIEEALSQFDGNRSEAAKFLRMSRSTIHWQIKRTRE